MSEITIAEDNSLTYITVGKDAGVEVPVMICVAIHDKDMSLSVSLPVHRAKELSKLIMDYAEGNGWGND